MAGDSIKGEKQLFLGLVADIFVGLLIYQFVLG